jgi:hypothetical protein
MSNKSSAMKRKGGNILTKKMIANRMDDMATLMTAMEATLMEWEIWFRLLKIQKKNLTPEQYQFVIDDGPIFTDFPQKIMNSVREQMPPIEEAVEEEKKPNILGTDGLPVQKDTPKILDSSGRTPQTKV